MLNERRGVAWAGGMLFGLKNTLGMLALVGASMAVLPVAEAHQDGCLIAQHVDFIQIHQLCFTDPQTCFSNAEAQPVRVSFICVEPENHPCLMKTHAPEAQQVDVCT